MKNTLETLLLIKNSIINVDHELTLNQINNLKSMSLDIDNDALAIIAELDDFNYSKAIILIDDYLSKHSAVEAYIDKELQGLRLELIALESQLEELTLVHIEHINTINSFNNLQNRIVGPVILEILKLRARISQLLKSNDDYYQDIKDQFEDAQQEYDDFQRAYQSVEEQFQFEISDENKKILKKQYKQASRLCHPDKVSIEFKPQANKIFSELNSAYTNNDLPKVQEILEELKSGAGFSVDSYSIDNKQILKSKIQSIRKKIEEVKSEIQKVKEDKIYKVIEENDDLEKYFNEMREKLEVERDELEEKLGNILS
jgi:hypothetical protein